MDNDNLCKFCEENGAKYVCPRCNSPYCSVECYRSQNHLVCSEAFYKECVEDELLVRDPDPQVRKTMLDILKRNYENYDESSSEDSDDETSLEDRLKGIDLDETTEVWSKLTVEEQREFLELADKGDITNLVPIWNPWWSKTYRIPKVSFQDFKPEESYLSICPSVRSDILSLPTISKSNPSPLVFNNLINVISSYALMTRYMNGEHGNSPHESSSILLALSKNLSNNAVFETLELAIESVSSESMTNQVIEASRENVSEMRNDLAKIMMGPNEENPSFYVLSALSDCGLLLSSAVKLHGPQRQTMKDSLPGAFHRKVNFNITKKQFMLAEKKLQYYLSWVTTCYIEIIQEYKACLPT